MSKIKYTITLKSDGEPGSGFGTELIDSLLPRDKENRVIIPATHIKGIIRENLVLQTSKIIDCNAIKKLFGEEGSANSALFHLDNAIAEKAEVFSISRTSINKCSGSRGT